MNHFRHFSALFISSFTDLKNTLLNTLKLTLLTAIACAITSCTVTETPSPNPAELSDYNSQALRSFDFLEEEQQYEEYSIVSESPLQMLQLDYSFVPNPLDQIKAI